MYVDCHVMTDHMNAWLCLLQDSIASAVHALHTADAECSAPVKGLPARHTLKSSQQAGALCTVLPTRFCIHQPWSVKGVPCYPGSCLLRRWPPLCAQAELELTERHYRLENGQGSW